MANERFHIAEWYGKPFHRLLDRERIAYAEHKVGKAKISKSEVTRLLALQDKETKSALKPQEAKRLGELRSKLSMLMAEEKPCPFKIDTPFATCTKQGGVCSIRLYQEDKGTIQPIAGERGRLRALCPYRFHQSGKAFQIVGERLLGDSNPIRAGELGFLESTGNLDSEAGEDVGRIDMILVKSNGSSVSQFDWAAVEIQAVYFSGKNMGLEFEHILKIGGSFSMPVERRRPDYRSSGVKRLMPQLLTKIPTLRRWGKRMAVVVDAPFFQSLGKMTKESDISNADIIWFVADFIEYPEKKYFELCIIDEFYTTLESATLGLTGGIPLSKADFEDRIKEKVRKV